MEEVERNYRDCSCGSNAIIREGDAEDNWFCWCLHCGKYSPETKGYKKAVDEWNKLQDGLRE